MPSYELVAGDRGSKEHVTIRDSVTKALIDLTGKTVQIRFSLNGGTTVQQTMTVLNQTTNRGEAEYLYTAAELAAGGELRGEVRLDPGGAGQLTTVDTFHHQVKAPLP